MIDQQQLQDNRANALKNLKVAQAESAELKKEKDKLEARLKEIDQRIIQLHGTHYSRGGLMDTLKADLDKAELEIKHSTSRPVVWAERNWCNGDYVVEKVTAKRIYVCRFGSTRPDLFNLDGTTVSKGSRDRIDIAKTFPEGLANWTGAK